MMNVVRIVEEPVIELFPPRVLGRNGVSAATWGEDGGGLRSDAFLAGVRVACHVRRQEDRWEMAMSLSNDGGTVDVAVRYPSVYYRFPGCAALRELDPLFGGVLEKHRSAFARRYPGEASLCATLVTTPERALALAVCNGDQRRVRITHVPGEDSGQMGMEIECVRIREGETIELPRAYLAHGRTWGDVLRPYRDWLAATFQRPQPLCSWYWDGPWVETRYAHCLAPVPPTKHRQEGVWSFDNARPLRTFDQLRQEMDEAFETLGQRGVKPLFYQFGWWKSMASCPGMFQFDTVAGDCDEGGHSLTRPVIDYLHSKGGRTFLYTNFISAGEDSQVFRDHPELFARDAAGFPIRNAEYPMFLFCPGVPGMRDYWDGVLRTILVDLDADGFFLDQVGGGTPSAHCHDPSHAHAHPDVYGRDYLALLDWVCRRAREIRPDCFIGGELTSDVRGLWCDQMQGVGYSRPQPHDPRATAPETVPPPEHFAFMSFVSPELAHLPSGAEYLARGCPGLPDDPLWRKYRHIFRVGLQPCETERIGATAYLFGPLNGESILVTFAPLEIGLVTVTLPVPMIPKPGTGHLAVVVDCLHVRAQAGATPRFHLLGTVRREE